VIKNEFSYKILKFSILKFFSLEGLIFFPKPQKVPISPLPLQRAGGVARICTPDSRLIISSQLEVVLICDASGAFLSRMP
jgi:hypothetical protein